MFKHYLLYILICDRGRPYRVTTYTTDGRAREFTLAAAPTVGSWYPRRNKHTHTHTHRMRSSAND